MITRASEGRLACSATTTWTVAWSDQGASGPWAVAGQVVSMQDDQGDDIADALDQLRRAACPAGPPCVG
jgi:hypothetical protein